jgi:predicted transposase/invertase (TIGR01784 family)
MIKYHPKVDIAFRKLFSSEENIELLISLVNGVLDDLPRLTALTLKNPYTLAEYIGEKTSILDIKAVDERGVQYDIEMQLDDYGYYGKRALYYLSKLYTEQLPVGMEYETLNTTIGIHLIEFDWFKDDRYRRHYVWKDWETNEFSEHLSSQHLYFIEMGKFRKNWNELSTLLDRWVAFLNKAHLLSRETLPPELRAEPEIVEAMTKLEKMFLDPHEQQIYDAEEKKRRDEYEKLRTALAKGLKEGEEKGRAEGREEGLLEGEAKTTQKIALQMLRRQLPLETIAETTGLQLEEILALRDDNIPGK